MGWNAAGQRGVIVDIELQKMEQGVIYSFESAIDVYHCQRDMPVSRRSSMPFSIPK